MGKVQRSKTRRFFCTFALLLTLGGLSLPGLGPVQVALGLPSSGEQVTSNGEVTLSGEASESYDGLDVLVTKDDTEAKIDGASFAVCDFIRAQKGSERAVEGLPHGYNYYQGTSADFVTAISTDQEVLVYVPESAHSICDVADEKSCNELKAYLVALDQRSPNGGILLKEDVTWTFFSKPVYEREGLRYEFGVEVNEGHYYLSIQATGAQQGQIPTPSMRPAFVDFLRIVPPESVVASPEASGIVAFGEFLAAIDLSPLWVTLRTTLTALVLIVVFGLAAAYFTLRISSKWRTLFDALFTIPMVLPPTVCGFLLLLLLGRSTALGQWFIDIGFPLIFSWPATVIAAFVVAFPLMYRSARGAFEGLDADMLDAARTLGWSNGRIFFQLMLPLSFSSLAAGAMLSFARALGEFGATLFLAGNYMGITRTIPIAIYFEWMNGNVDVALFWTVIILLISVIFIILINYFGKRTARSQ